MQKLHYPGVEETLYYEQLPNGLSVYLLPKEGFQKTYATFSTRYGSVDNHFRSGSQPLTRVPDGIAHFLEHKMFEEPQGDIFATFASQGLRPTRSRASTAPSTCSRRRSRSRPT